MPDVAARGAALRSPVAGVAQWHHVNDLELSYRTLMQYGFDENDVFVLCHSGVQDKTSPLFADNSGGLRKWPGDNTDFTMKVDGPGTAGELQRVFSELAQRMTPKDMLFIHMDGHGGCDAIPDSDPRRNKGSFLCTWALDPPIGGKYFAVDLKDHLQAIGTQYRSLLVLAQQCHGGGFKQSVVDGSTALATSVACAAEKSGLSFWSPDKNFNKFTLDWLSAQRRELVTGGSLLTDGNGSGAIEANEAYDYAMAKHDYRDSPNSASKPAGADRRSRSASRTHWRPIGAPSWRPW